MIRRKERSFGPEIAVDGDKLTASCSRCIFYISNHCTHVNPTRHIPDFRETPEWCEMLESTLRDAREFIAGDSGCVKTHPDAGQDQTPADEPSGQG